MNHAIRSGGGPTTANGLDLAEQLPALLVRLRGPEVDHLGQLLDNSKSETVARLGMDILRARDLDIHQRDQLADAFVMADNERSRRRTLEHHLRRTRRGRALWGDLRAMKRWLDPSAVMERLHMAIDVHGVHLEILASLLSETPLENRGVQFLSLLLGDPRLPTRRAAAATLVSHAVRGQDEITADSLRTTRLVENIQNDDILTARRCLGVLPALVESEAREVFQQVFEEEAAGRDPFLLRAKAVRAGLAGPVSWQAWVVPAARADASETVRCALLDGIATDQAPAATDLLRTLSRTDPAPSVRTRARRLLREHGHPRVRLEDPLHRTRHLPDPAVEELADVLANLPVGRSRIVALPFDTNPMELARALVFAADHSHGFTLGPAAGGKVRVTRGEKQVIRFWRLLHEFRNPAPDKRHLGDHLTGRAAHGPIRVPPERLGGAAPTHPGQRIRDEGLESWAPWLPMPEDCLEAADWGSLVLVTSQGITTLSAPRDTSARLKAQWAINWHMKSLADARMNALSAGDPEGRGRFAAGLSSLGFTMDFETHADAGMPTPHIEQYFGGIMSPLALMLGAHRNTPGDLAVAAGAVAVLYFSRLAWAQHAIRRDRGTIPLVIGGWGTRGKTSTERLKAALFQGLGYPVLCRTTGSEASALYSPGGELQEVLRWERPMGKASIWEHPTLLTRAAALQPRVLLWECMALRGDYVDQLQSEWTRDDLSTLTNAHPDHEDVQGPGAEDVAQVICRFIPPGAPILTTEQEMLPLLREAAHRKEAPLRAVETTEAVPRDLLERFPYGEHPQNLALVRALAKELGLDDEEALILMADHVVPDLGSLATAGPFRHLGRRVSFTNAMSANHRMGFLSSWKRAGFSGFVSQAKPDEFLVTIVNNRRDRVARSRVFAELLVHRATAHRHILMGTNVRGLLAEIQTQLGAFLQELTLGSDPRGVQRRLNQLRNRLCLVGPGALIRSTATRLGLDKPLTMSVTRALDQTVGQPPSEPLGLSDARALLGPLLPRLEALAETAQGPAFHDEMDRRRGTADLAEQWLTIAAEAMAFAALVRFSNATDDVQERDETARILAREIFLSHITLLEDSSPLGDRITRRVAEVCPAGVHVRAMGIQNIGGPGLGLARDWVHARSLQRTLESLDDSQAAPDAVQALSNPPPACLPALQEARSHLQALDLEENLQDPRDVAVVQLDAAIAERQAALALGRLPMSSLERVVSWVSSQLAPLWAIRQRRQAEQVWRDLADHRISVRRAAEVLGRLDPVEPLDSALRDDPIL